MGPWSSGGNPGLALGGRDVRGDVAGMTSPRAVGGTDNDYRDVGNVAAGSTSAGIGRFRAAWRASSVNFTLIPACASEKLSPWLVVVQIILTSFWFCMAAAPAPPANVPLAMAAMNIPSKSSTDFKLKTSPFANTFATPTSTMLNPFTLNGYRCPRYSSTPSPHANPSPAPTDVLTMEIFPVVSSAANAAPTARTTAAIPTSVQIMGLLLSMSEPPCLVDIRPRGGDTLEQRGARDNGTFVPDTRRDCRSCSTEGRRTKEAGGATTGGLRPPVALGESQFGDSLTAQAARGIRCCPAWR